MAAPSVPGLAELPEAAKALSKHVSVPVGMLLVLLLFLFVQNRIDRNDPKIRVTEASSTETLPFSLPRGARQTPRRTIPVRRATVVAAAPTSIQLPA